jgi:tetratricopeptide (TPR) repeat protein
MLDDGTAPLFSVVIETVCDETSHSQGRTDGRGYFSVQLGQATEAIGDASETNGDFSRTIPHTSSLGRGFGPGDRFANCDLRARLGGYRSQSISLADRGPMDNPDVGVILLHRIRESEEATTVTATTIKAPKAARKALEKGMDLAKRNKLEEAIASLQEAVKLDPEFAFAWCELGKLQMENGHAGEAYRSLESAAKAEPRWPEPYLHLALLAARSENWKEVAEVTDRVLQLDSFEYPQAFFFNAVANYSLKHPEAAEKSARSAERLDTRHQFPQIARLLGAILVARHRYAEAADELRKYLMLAPRAADAPAVRKQLDDLEKLALGSSQVAGKEQR